SFHPKIAFYKKWNSFFPALTITALLFIAWDIYFTHLGVWGFNPAYLSGLTVLSLPIEEWLFFICIPYACVFTHFCLIHFTQITLPKRVSDILTRVLILLLLILFILNSNKYYTSVTTFLTALFLVYIYLINPTLLQRFYISYLILFIGPFLLVNGILTGSWIADQVVWYNNSENLGIRFMTIPIEDFIYGFLLFLMNLQFFDKFDSNFQPKNG
ncbi:MAG: lycopene cyclase domain-containing protein, partial [Calditrichaeota bacterium]|nr:lycopene cyclase domain-containing protein [Calditrichota bacterium]